MHIILGGTGHIGSALASILLERGEAVTVISRTPSKALNLQRQGAQVAVADVNDVKALRHILRQGQRLFLLNPPADPSTDTDAEERKSIASILAALDGADLQKVVAESTYGAQPGARMGDLGVLYEMEQVLAEQPIPVTVIRGAYYMSNWDAQLQSIREKGIVHTFFPPDFKLPMVAPADIGKVAADLMTESAKSKSLHYVEGPERYSSNDVAAAFAKALRRPVEAVQIPRSQWPKALKSMGFSAEAAASFTNMTEATLAAQFPDSDIPTRGATSLQNYSLNLADKIDLRN